MVTQETYTANSDTFGSRLKSIRTNQRIGFSVMLWRTGFDASDYSKMERGLMPAPTNDEKLSALRIGLGLPEDSGEWNTLARLAHASHGAIPAYTLNHERIISSLCAFHVTFTDNAWDDAYLADVTQKIWDAHKAEPEGEVRWSNNRTSHNCLSVAHISKYLHDNGWKQVASQNANALIFHGLLDIYGKPLVAVLPAREALIDAKRCKFKVVRMLAKLAAKSISGVTRDIIRANIDLAV